MTTAQQAQLALLIEVTSNPKPGNVDRYHDYPDLRFEHFVAGAIGSYHGLRAAAGQTPLGSAFEQAVRGMSEWAGRNTQFGALLLLVPLIRASTNDELTPGGVSRVVEATTVADAEAFYRSFDHVDVFVNEPPDDLIDLDVTRGANAIPVLRDRGLTLFDVMTISADRDGVASEWVTGFEETFWVADYLMQDGAITDLAADAFLELLGSRPDTFVAKQHGPQTAQRVTERAREGVSNEIDPNQLADEFVAGEINPGTTADIIAGGLFIAFERGVKVLNDG